MNPSIIYTSDEGILKQAYGPCAVLLVCATCVVLTISNAPAGLKISPSTLAYILLKPFILIALPLATLVGIWGLISAIVSPFLKLPRLTLTTEGIKLERFLSTWIIAWDELAPFEFEFGKDVQAKIISGRYKRKGKLIIPPLNVDKMTLFNQLNEWREMAISSDSTRECHGSGERLENV